MSQLSELKCIVQGIADLSFAEDTAHTTGDSGIMALAVRSDADVAFGADGDYTPLQTDEGGRLKVSIEGATVNVGIDPTRGTLTDASGTITTGGISQQIFAVNATRRMFLIQNISDEDMWVNFTSAASAGAGSYKLTPGGILSAQGIGFTSTEAINIFGATTGKAFTAKQA